MQVNVLSNKIKSAITSLGEEYTWDVGRLKHK